MFEIWKEATDNNKAFGALLTDLLKTFDCLSHDLFIVKLYAYGNGIDLLNIPRDYLSNRKQRTKMDSFLALWKQYPLEYLQALYLDHFCSIYSCAKSF